MNNIPLTKSGKPETSLVPSTDDKQDARKTINVLKAFDLRYKHNMSYRQIAEYLGVSKTGVHEALTKFEKYIPNIEELEIYRKNAALFMEAVDYKHLEALQDADKLKKASLNNVAYSWDKIRHHLNLELNKPTQNVFILHGTVANIKDKEQNAKP